MTRHCAVCTDDDVEGYTMFNERIPLCDEHESGLES